MQNSKTDKIIQSLRRYIRLYASISIGLFLFILFFQPFYALDLNDENHLLFVSGFGAIIFIFMVLIHVVFYPRFSSYYNEEQPGSLYFYLLNLILIGLSSVSYVFYMRYVGRVGITFNVVVKTVIICASPAIVLNLAKTLQQTRQKYSSLLREMRELQQKYKQFSKRLSESVIELSSENNSEKLTVSLSDLLFIKSADNYVEIGYKEDGLFKKKLLRNTLRNVESQLQTHTNFIRTHRTCIVNIQFLDVLYRDNNTYWVKLVDTEETVPVSRQYLLVVKEIL